MKIQKRWPQKIALRFGAGLRTVPLLFLAILTSSFVLFQSVPVGAAQTTNQYCSQYTSNSKLNACKDGVRGADCSDYAITFDQATADICTKAAKAKTDGQISDTPAVNPSGDGSNTTDAEVYKNVVLNACSSYQSDPAAALWCLYGGLGQNGTEGKPKTVADCLNKPELQGSTRNQGACITGSSAGRSYLAEKAGNTDEANNINTDANSIQDILDQTGNLSQYVDLLHAVGMNSGVNMGEQADNNYGFYVNGAGKQQAITPILSGQPNSPAIIFFNGGGWHADDGVSHCVAAGTPGNAGTCAVGGVAQGGFGGDNTPPPGGGATARGFTVFNATYRYGSSGVYYMFEDVLRAIQHVRNNADMYGIDPNKIAIWGDSSGGSLSMRANATGKSGAKAAVGWSAPTNAYTGLFKSYKSLLIGMDHSTCIPTDLAGLTNFTDLVNGGSGNVAQYGQGLSSNSFDSFTGGNPLNLLGDVLTAGQYAAQSGQNIEAISSQLESGGIEGMSGGVINLASNKLIECIDNFNALSPALFASPDSSPAFLAGFNGDDVVDPQQLYDMRDKLRSLGIRSDALVLQGDPNAPGNFLGPIAGNHLGYDSRFVCDSLNFVDEIMQTGKHVDCGSGIGENNGSGGGSGSGGGGGSSGGGGSGGSGSSGGSGGGGGGGGATPGSGGQDCTNKGGIGGSAGCDTSGPCDSNPTLTNPNCKVYSGGGGSFGGCDTKDPNCQKTVTGAGKAPAPGKGRAFNIDSSSSATDVNTSIAYTCPSGRADSSAVHGTTITYVCR